jgi:hypothetical protein
MIYTNPINNIPAVASGGLCSFFLPIGVRHFGFSLFLFSAGTATAPTTTNLLRVRIIIDNVALIDWDWTSIFNYYTRKGYVATTGEIPLFFADPALVGLRNWAAGSIDTKQGITSFQVQVQLGTITTPTLTGVYHFDQIPNRRRTGGTPAAPVYTYFNTPIKKYTQVENLPANGNWDITDIASTYPLDTVTIYGVSTSISYVRCQLNSVTVFEGTPLAISQRILQYGVITPTGTIVLPFTYDRQSPRSAARFSNIDILVTNTSGSIIAAGVGIEVQLPTLT